ncbi:MAG: hypothetical protein P9L91_02945 [Candidatus Zophobacter franzmannii]|nr:hypothetical protein [Candidatus Zophobacter franzmannii]
MNVTIPWQRFVEYSQQLRTVVLRNATGIQRVDNQKTKASSYYVLFCQCLSMMSVRFYSPNFQ